MCNLINKKNIVNIYRIEILLNTLIFVFLFFMESKIVNYIYFLQESNHAFGKIIEEILLLFVVMFPHNLQNLQIMIGVFSTTVLLQALEYKKISDELKEKNKTENNFNHAI